MNDHLSDDARNRSAIDREIEAALSVDPSPEFVARVRARVANDPAPVGWRLPWLITVAGAAAAAVVILVVVSHPGQRAGAGLVNRAPLSAKATSEGAVAQPPAVLVEQPRVAESDAKTKRPAVVASGFPGLSVVEGSRTRDVASSSGRTEPEILIDAGEARALRRLLEGVRVGRIDVTILPLEPPQVMTTIQSLGEIPPIRPIEPLGQAAQGAGVQQ